MKSIETVSVRRNGANWEHVSQIVEDDGSSHLSLHIIPNESFANYAKFFEEEDCEKVLDLVLFAPYVECPTREAYADVIARLKPMNKTPHARLVQKVKLAGIPDQYHPNGSDPREVLLEAAQEGIDHVKVQQAHRSPDRRVAGGDSVARGGEQRRDDLDAGMADVTRVVPARSIRRVVARKRFADEGADRSGAQEP